MGCLSQTSNHNNLFPWHSGQSCFSLAECDAHLRSLRCSELLGGLLSSGQNLLQRSGYGSMSRIGCQSGTAHVQILVVPCGVCVRACVRACLRAWVGGCVRGWVGGWVCMYVCVCVSVCACAICVCVRRIPLLVYTLCLAVPLCVAFGPKSVHQPISQSTLNQKPSHPISRSADRQMCSLETHFAMTMMCSHICKVPARLLT